jgi:hypothetical protein
MFAIMRFRKSVIILFLCAFSFIAQSQTADEIINRYIAFIGGGQKWKTIKTLTTSGTYTYGGMTFPFTSYAKAPDKYKYVVAANGKAFTQAYDGKDGWRIDGFKDEKKKTILKGDAGRDMANEADVVLENPFIDYSKKGHTVLLEGIDSAANRVCYKIKLVRKDGDTATYFFDRENFSLIKKQAIAQNTELEHALLDIVYSDYRLTSGIYTPHKIICSTNGQEILAIKVKQVRLNIPMADSIFKP